MRESVVPQIADGFICYFHLMLEFFEHDVKRPRERMIMKTEEKEVTQVNC